MARPTTGADQDANQDANQEMRRGPRSRERILQATIDLLLDRGYRGLSIEGIAERVGVSKVTIYRWWPHKAAVAMDAFLAFNEPRVAFPDTGSVREDIRRQIQDVIRFFTGPGGAMLKALIAEAQHDPKLAEDFQTRFTAKRRQVGKAVLMRGVERGELPDTIDFTALIDQLYAPLYLRLLLGHADLRPELANTLVDYVFDGVALRADPAPTRRSTP
jgi:AcrR family transcriptional regulator